MYQEKLQGGGRMNKSRLKRIVIEVSVPTFIYWCFITLFKTIFELNYVDTFIWSLQWATPAIVLFLWYMMMLPNAMMYEFVPNGYNLYKNDIIKRQMLKIPVLLICGITVLIFKRFNVVLLLIFIALEIVSTRFAINSYISSYRHSLVFDKDLKTSDKVKKEYITEVDDLNHKLKLKVIFKSIVIFVPIVIILGYNVFAYFDTGTSLWSSIQEFFKMLYRNRMNVSLVVLISIRVTTIVYRTRFIERVSNFTKLTEQEYKRGA